MTVDFKEGFDGRMNAGEFEATCSSSPNPMDARELTLKTGTTDGNTLTMTFDAIQAQPVEQVITLDLFYIPDDLSMRPPPTATTATTA